MCGYNGPNKNYMNSSVMSTELETEDTIQHMTTTKQHSNCNNLCYRSQDCQRANHKDDENCGKR